jgi:LysR family transcriptional regulator, glycine cleavage system transcriptional activator
MPSLQTLRAFEAAGRLNSYSKAAEELALTHGAVSHRIRELEERLGLKLFQRTGNVMRLTEDGHRLHAQVRQGLSMLEQAFASPRARSAKGARPIVVSAVPSLAATWLSARLGEYRAERPEVDIELRVTDRLSDFKKEGVDLGVRLGRGGWDGMQSTKLFDEALTPVCTPAYCERLNLREPADLERASFLRNAWTPWARWFRAAGLDWPEPARGPVFDDSGLLLRAALQGDGVALGRHWLAIDDVRAGRLCAPFSVSLRDDFSYWLVWQAGRNLSPDTAQFRDWLAARAAAEEHPCPLSSPDKVVAA